MKKEYAQYLLEKTTEDYNLIADNFSSTRSYFWTYLQFLSQYIKAGDRVLDLGCGNGRLLELLKDRKIIYTGLDSSQKLVAIARKKHPGHNFITANALSLPLEGASFDIIYSIAVLHHIPSQEIRLTFLKEAKRVLKPGGQLVLTVWNLNIFKRWPLILKHVFLKFLGRSQLDLGDLLVPWGKIKRYVHFFSKQELEGLIIRAGFEKIEIGIAKKPQGKESNFYLVVKKPH